MTATAETLRASSLWRRHWPALALVVGVVSFGSTVALANYLDDRIVYVGPVNAYLFDVFLALVTVWCLAAFLLGYLAMLRGPWIWSLVQGVLASTVVIGAFGLSVIVSFVVALLVGGAGEQIKLDTPAGSPKYIVSALTFGNTNLTLYGGNGTVYERLDVRLPAPDRSTSFASDHRVESESDGQLFLVYQEAPGSEVRVPLPLE